MEVWLRSSLRKQLTFHNATAGFPQTPKKMSKEKLQKFHTGDVSRPGVVPLIGWNFVNFLWSLTIQKHYPDLGSDTLFLCFFLRSHFVGKPAVMPWNVGCSSHTNCVVDLCDKLLQRAKKVVPASPGLVYFLLG